VLIQCGGTDALQLAACQGRLHQVGDVKATTAATTATNSASTNKGVNLINPAQRQQQKATRAQYSDFQLPD
jgi:hypothetical protein